MSTCTVPGCGRARHARGWCDGHYTRWQRNGDVRASVPLRSPRSPVLGCGTVAAYQRGCRCAPCLGANAARKRAEYQPRMAPAAPVVAHLQALLVEGLTRSDIAALADLPYSTISDVLRRGPRSRVDYYTAEHVLAVELEPSTFYLPAGPLVEAVERSGRSIRAELSDADSRAFYRACERGTIREDIADRVAIRLLHRTLDELYGPGWDEVAA